VPVPLCIPAGISSIIKNKNKTEKTPINCALLKHISPLLLGTPANQSHLSSHPKCPLHEKRYHKKEVLTQEKKELIQSSPRRMKETQHNRHAICPRRKDPVVHPLCRRPEVIFCPVMSSALLFCDKVEYVYMYFGFVDDRVMNCM
jgi:hypothetical protein